MPELPEVETTLRAIKKFQRQKLIEIKVNNRNLRWKVDKSIEINTKNQRILNLKRRAKYIIFNLSDGFIILHLGMSGNIRIQDLKSNTYKKHDHIIFYLKDKKII